MGYDDETVIPAEESRGRIEEADQTEDRMNIVIATL